MSLEPPADDGRERARSDADLVPTTALPVVPELLLAGSTDAVPEMPSHRRRRPRIVVALAAAVVVLLGLSGYLVVATRAHEHASVAWRTLAERKADELASTKQDLDGATNELTAVREQLATATTRITELANEKAQIGDEVATQQQLTDYQKRIGAAAATVASALDRCVTAQQTLIGYLRDAASYSSTDLARYSSDVDALCRSAQDANTSLQTELSR